MKVFQYSNIGEREVNEDYVVTKDFGNDINLYLVADGMGGYSCGDIASKIVGDGIASLIGENSINDTVKAVSANLTQARKNLGVRKMGSTVAGVLIEGMNATIFWAGDSRVYVYRDKQLIYQTEDHSIVNELQKVRKLTFDERKKYSHILTRSLMGKKDDKVDINEIKLEKDDEILICTDGIYNDCPVEYIIDTLRTGCFDIDKHNQDFADNHSLVYIVV